MPSVGRFLGNTPCRYCGTSVCASLGFLTSGQWPGGAWPPHTPPEAGCSGSDPPK